VCATAAYSAYDSRTFYRIPRAWVFGLVALLFNPLIPVKIDMATWGYLDIAVGVFFLVSLFFIREDISTKGGQNEPQ
jgi:hypothetical protein